MKKKILLIFLCLGLLITTGCGKIPKLQNGEELVAKVNGHEISAEELYKEMKKHSGVVVLVNLIDNFIADKEIPTDDDIKQYAESRLEQIKLQYQQMGEDFLTTLKSSGIKNEEEFKKILISDYKRTKIVEKHLREKLTEKEIKKYYDEEIFGAMTAKHILIKPETIAGMSDSQIKDAENKALEKAKEVIDKLNKGAKFEDLVKEYSDDTGSVDEGGLISDFTKDKVAKEFWDATYKLKNNEYTKTPVKSTFGYHIILKVSAKDKPKLDDVKDEIEEILVSQKLENDQNLQLKVWAEIRKKYNLEITDTDMKDYYDNSIKLIK